ncbi:AMIN-like domain-containing (lipo)protein [Oerskovia turbata]
MDRTPRRLRPAALAVLAVLLTLPACASADDGADGSPSSTSASSESSTPATTPSATDSPSVSPTDTTDDDSSTTAPPFPANSEADLADASPGAALTVTDIRIGRHDGFDRVVYELGGTGTPGWRVEYVPEALDDGSGEVVDVAGSGTLLVSISGSGYPHETGQTEFSASPVRAAGTQQVEEVVFRGVFEGYAKSFIGTDTADNPFRVYALTNPTRVVVEIRDDA